MGRVQVDMASNEITHLAERGIDAWTAVRNMIERVAPDRSIVAEMVLSPVLPESERRVFYMD